MVECPLCYAHFGSSGADSEAYCFRGCGHVFCRGCIRQLRQLGCPTCRWRPTTPYANNLSKAVVLKLFVDFSDVNTLQTKLDDTEKQLATAQLEMEQLKEKLKAETARLRKRLKDETDSLHRANKEVEYLTRRLADEKAKDTAALVSETVKATLQHYVNAPLVPSSDKLLKIPHAPATPAKAHERTANVAAVIPPGPSVGVQFPLNKYQAEAKQDPGNSKAKASVVASVQRIPAVSSHVPPARPPSPNAMDWSPSGLPIEIGRFEVQQRNAPQSSTSVARETRSNVAPPPFIAPPGNTRPSQSLFGIPP